LVGRLATLVSLVIAVAVFPLEGQTLYDQARAADARGQLDSAYALIQRAADAEPGRAEVQWLLGDIACRKAERAGAFSAFGLARKCKEGFGRAVELAPDSTTYVESLASFLAQAPGMVGGDKDSAQKLVAVVRARDEVRGVFLQASIWLAGNAASRARSDSMIDALAAAHPQDRLIQLRSAQWYTETRRDEKALPLYEGLAARDPQDVVARFFVGRELVVLKRELRRAQEQLRFAAAATPPAGRGVPSFAPGAPWYRLGQAYEQLGMSDSARICFERALQVNPQLVPARLSLDSLTHP
jgi:tetratricopeptide (TPR) repeat protein